MAETFLKAAIVVSTLTGIGAVVWLAFSLSRTGERARDIIRRLEDEDDA